jgi:CheY-like chemotaxis protein
MPDKILVCEDNKNNGKLITDLLEYHGFAVFLAVNGEEGIEMARQVKPDLILMDMQMPVLDGFEAIKRIRSDPELREVKIIGVTSFAMAGDKQRVMGAGADDYVPKPINTRTLPVLIREVIAKKNPSPKNLP